MNLGGRLLTRLSFQHIEELKLGILTKWLNSGGGEDFEALFYIAGSVFSFESGGSENRNWPIL